jgi:hypothetical protein
LTGNVHAFLDNYVILGKRWCERCVTALSDSSVGAVTGRVLVRLEEYGLDFVPESLKWVVGGTYWDSKVPISVFSAAGMNFCIKKEVFLKAGGYNENLGPRGDRPEMARWHRLVAEESDLAIRVWLETGLKVVYDPNVIVEHKLRPESILLGGLVRRALHVGHNRAYVHSRYPRVGVVNDYQTFKRLVKELTFIAKKFLGDHIVCGKVGTSTYKNHILLIPRYLDDRDMAVVKNYMDKWRSKRYGLTLGVDTYFLEYIPISRLIRICKKSGFDILSVVSYHYPTELYPWWAQFLIFRSVVRYLPPMGHILVLTKATTKADSNL